MSEELLQHKLQAIAHHFGNIAGFIHLHPSFTSSEIPAFPPREKAIVKHIFLIAKHLQPFFQSRVFDYRHSFLTVHRLDGAFGLDYRFNYSVISGGLFGLTKTLQWEWPGCLARSLDLDPTFDVETVVKHIMAEVHDCNQQIREVAYGAYGRVTLQAVLEG
ncbi:hypothetical protein [Chrysosporum bergii]|jgi:hypothetical protein|uniref:hypothetical protein n=1 Tax=Chrysosporum bergii TaxID=105352 RepID=UPI003CC85657